MNRSFIVRLRKFISLSFWSREIKSPSLSVVSYLLNLVYWLLSKLGSISKNYTHGIFIWDARTESITFDFCWAILNSFFFFNSKGFDQFRLIIYVSPLSISSPTFLDYRNHVSTENMIRRVYDLILPLANSFTCVSSVCLVSSLSDIPSSYFDCGLVFPFGYNSSSFYPHSLNYRQLFSRIKSSFTSREHYPHLQPYTSSKVEYISKSHEKYVENRVPLVPLPQEKFITLTLRDYGFQSSRNTSQRDVDIISQFADQHNFRLLIVPDDLSKVSQYCFPVGSILLPEARGDLNIRMQVYSRSSCNFFSVAGSAAVSHHIKGADYHIQLCYRRHQYSQYHSKGGFSPGSQPFLAFDCYLLWAHNNAKYSVFDLNNAYYFLRDLT